VGRVAISEWNSGDFMCRAGGRCISESERGEVYFPAHDDLRGCWGVEEVTHWSMEIVSVGQDADEGWPEDEKGCVQSGC
jgi:hypothetical protein